MRKIRKGFLLLSLLMFLWAEGFGQEASPLKEKAYQFMHSQVDSSIYYWALLETQAEEQADTASLVEALRFLNVLYRMKGNVEKASTTGFKFLSLLDHYPLPKKDQSTAYVNIAMSIEMVNSQLCDSLCEVAEAIAVELQDTVLIKDVKSNYGAIQKARGDLYGAVDNLIEALSYTVHDLPRSSLCTNIAIIFLRLQNYDRAEEYILEAVRLSDQNNYKTRHGVLGMTYAQLLMKKGAFREAKEELEESIRYFSSLEKWGHLAQVYQLLTDFHILQNEWELAAENNRQALAYLDLSPPVYQSQILLGQYQILLHKKKYREALAAAEQSLQIAQKSLLANNVKNALEAKAISLDYLGQTKDSYAAFKQYQQLEDSLYRSQQVAQLLHLESQYKRQEQESNIALLDTKNALQANQLSQQHKLLVIGGISLAIILGMLFFLYRLFQKIKIQNAIIQKALEEKDTLLREIHHRVKNNLQLVSSLLGLQSRHIEDPAALEALNSGKSRVKSMALIHQDLYNRENLTGVSVKEYLEKLCQELVITYKIDTQKIKLETDIADLQLDVDTLVPLGLIINELLTNALKYAFPDQREGQIKITLRETAQQLHLEVSDNGIGINPHEISSSSFGYKLVDTLLEQLDGEIQRGGKQGTHLSLVFRDYKIAA